ncbi:MAG: branched-chain amino acid ABC transporter permease [Firmicutes bacterium]|nr:branched-chain amino acid ABC transporter permease [Bacillota bacterium]
MSLLLEVAMSGLLLGGVYALIAVGLNLQYGLMRILNVAHGEFLMIGGYVTYLLVSLRGWNPLLTLLVSGPLLFAVGLAVHGLLFRHLVRLRRTREELEANSLLISFGLMFILQNVALILWQADMRGYRYLDQPLQVFGAVFPANRVVAFAIALGFTILLFAFLHGTLAGTSLRGLMQDVVGARLVGLPVRRMHAACFGLGAALAGVSGSLLSMLYPLTPDIGVSYTVTALIVIILGGLGSVAGSFAGGLLLGVVEALGVHFTDPAFRMVLKYGVLALVLVLRPYGLFNTVARRPEQMQKA